LVLVEGSPAVCGRGLKRLVIGGLFGGIKSPAVCGRGLKR